MKRIVTIAAIAAATILAASCAKEIEGGLQKEGIIAHASLQPVEATKAIGEYSYNIVWEENDKIVVLDNANSKASFKLKDGAGSTTGTFQQEGTDALTAPLIAYYPASVVADDKSLVWPATQADVKNITNVPMMAGSTTATGDVNFAFKHLGSVLQLVLTAKNGTIAVKQIDITADQGLSGAFAVSQEGTAVISSTGTTITTGDISDKNIKLSAAASYLNFAVPSGDFTNFKITIMDVNDKEYSLSAANLTLNRAMVNKVTFAMDAKNPAVIELEINGHKVTVKLADNTPASEVMVCAYIEGESVKVGAFSRLNYAIECIKDNEVLTPAVSNGLQTFTVSNISKDMVVTIGYITVSFDLNNSNITDNFKDKPADITRIVNNPTIAPTYASAEKHSFRGWYKDKECTEAWNYSTGVTKSITLYAKWAEDPTEDKINSHEFVKLGGYYWATENVSSNDFNRVYHDDTYGDYFNQCIGKTNDYNSTDNNALNAAKSFGEAWTLPSEAQWQALIDYCDWEWQNDYEYNGTTMNGMLVKGRSDTYESGHSIFLPAAGIFYDGSSYVNDQGNNGYYWSAGNFWYLDFSNGYRFMNIYNRRYGMAVRPVSE